MRVFFHFEKEPDFTVSFSVNSQDTTEAYLNRFCSLYNAYHKEQTNLNTALLSLQTKRQKDVPLDSLLQQHTKRDVDFFVVEKPGANAEEIQAIIEKELIKGVELIKKQHFKDAKTIFRKVLELIPNQLTCLKMLAHIYREAGYVNNFLKVVQQGVDAFPNDISFKVELGEALVLKKEYTHAIKLLIPVLKAY